MSLSKEVRSQTWFEYSEWAAAHGTREEAFLKIDQRGLADHIAELETKLDDAIKLCAYKEKQIMKERKRRNKAEAQLDAVREVTRDQTMPKYWRRQVLQAIGEDKT